MEHRNATIAAGVLLGVSAIGCSWLPEREVMVPPECEPAPVPALPDLDRALVWQLLRAGATLEAADPGDRAGQLRDWLSSDHRPPRVDAADRRGRDVYRKLERLENALTDWGLENEAVLEAVCR